MNKTIIPITGMHCRSCEILIGEKLKEIPDIKNVHVSYRNSQAEIYSKRPLDMELVRASVEEAGYGVGKDDAKDWITTDPNNFKDAALAFFALLVLYLIASRLGLFNLNLGGFGSNSSSLLVVLIVGLTAGVSTCMALVGGLVLGISARHTEKHPEATSIQNFRPHVFFNLGRILSYFILGGVIGLAGKAFQLSGPLLGALTIVVGFVMLLLGAQLTELFPRLSSGGLTLPVSVSKFLGISRHGNGEYSHKSSFLTGALTFFLPCGFTQSMQLLAMSTGNFWSGAAIMGVFALGTAPGLLGVGGITSIVKGVFASKFYKFAGLLVIVFAVINISNGWNLTGWRLGLPEQSVADQSGQSNQTNQSDSTNINNAEAKTIKTTYLSLDQDISPNNFTVSVNEPVIFEVDVKEDGIGCMSTIMIPGLVDKPVYLKKGTTISFKFTPTKRGSYEITCAMGVPRGTIEVV